MAGEGLYPFPDVGGTGVPSLEDAFRRFVLFLRAAVDMGVPLFPALRGLHATEKHPELHAALGEILVALEEGEPLTEVMKKRPGVFPVPFTALVEMAETAGSIERTLGVIAEGMKRGLYLPRE
jgi:type II secretory pathway component PulF